MANTLKIKRGLAASIPQGQLAEPLFTTDTYDLYIGKGAGGNQRIQNYIASGTSSQFLKGDGSLDSTTYQATSEKGQNNGYASLDAGGKIPAAQLPSSVIEYKGTWNASTNTPTLADGTGDAGDVYIVSVGGTQNLGSGSITFDAGDWVMYNGSVWQKSTGSNAVASVNGQTGIVVLYTDDISEDGSPTNLWYTDARARLALSATSPVQYNNSTGVISILDASGSQSGVVTTGTQTFAGAKTFSSDLTINGVTAGRGGGGESTSTAFGNTALFSNTYNSTSLANTAIGYRALYSNAGSASDGSTNTAVGADALYSNTTGSSNVAIGVNAGKNIIGSSNTFLGQSTFFTATSGSGNTVIGYNSGLSFTSGSFNTLIGYNTGGSYTSGSNNTIIGRFAGSATSISGNVIIADGSGNVRFQHDGTNGKLPFLTSNGFVKTSNSDGTLSVDTNTYLTTSSASSTYLPLAGGTLTGALNGTSATFSASVTTPSGFYIDANTYLYEGTLRLTDLVGKKNILQLQASSSGHYITSTFLSGGSQQAIYISAKSTAGQNVIFNTDGTTTFNHGITGTTASFTSNSGNFNLGSQADTAIYAHFGSKSASGGQAVAMRLAGTLTATANFDNLFGLWVDYTDNAAGYAGVTRYGIYQNDSGKRNYFGGPTTFNSVVNGSDTITATAFIPTGSSVPTNGMYLSASNTLNFATNSGSRLSISSTGAATFSSSVTANGTMQLADDGTYGSTYKMLAFTGNTNGSHRIFAGTADDIYIAAATGRGIRFWTNGSSANVLTLASTGAATFSSSVTAKDNLTLTGNYPSVTLTATSGTNFYIQSTYTSNRLDIGVVGGSPLMTILSGGSVGIGTTSPNYTGASAGVTTLTLGTTTTDRYSLLELTGNRGVGGNQNGVVAFVNNNGTATVTSRIVGVNGASNVLDGEIFFETRTSAGSLTERMRITSGGTIKSTLDQSVNNQFINLVGTQSSYNQEYSLGIATSSKDFRIYDITAGTERMRITSGGILMINQTGLDSAAGGGLFQMTQNNNNWIHNIRNSATSGGNYGSNIVFSAAPNNTASAFFAGSDSSAERYRMYANGGLANYQANNVNLSDIRTKKDIVSLESYWDKFKALEIVKFKYKDQTHDDFNIGVIAQQVEEVAPEFVDVDGWGETPEDGVPLKSVYTADLHHATIKVLQEAMAKIEVLESELAILKNK